MGKKINNYIEYQKRLKEFFSGIKEMPSSEEVQSFIDKYNLFIDWQIIILDVKKDISSLMLKNITGKAVDNQIKAEAGQLLKRGNQEVTFVSHDRGFDKYKNRKNDRSSGNRITTVKSVKDKLK